jgi:hypothetical protein
MSVVSVSSVDATAADVPVFEVVATIKDPALAPAVKP